MMILYIEKKKKKHLNKGLLITLALCEAPPGY